MAFGGFFGGSGSSENDKSSSSSSTSSPTNTDLPLTPPSISPFSSSASSNPSTSSTSSSDSSSAIKSRLQSAVVMQTNIINAKYLISKVNENCFDKCIPSPGSALSSKEQTCLSSCMEKYIEAWNVVSRTYVGRLQKEGAQLGGMVGQAGGI